MAQKNFKKSFAANPNKTGSVKKRVDGRWMMYQGNGIMYSKESGEVARGQRRRLLCCKRRVVREREKQDRQREKTRKMKDKRGDDGKKDPFHEERKERERTETRQ